LCIKAALILILIFQVFMHVVVHAVVVAARVDGLPM
jgi:hypothetical protein